MKLVKGDCESRQHQTKTEWVNDQCLHQGHRQVVDNLILVSPHLSANFQIVNLRFDFL